VEQSIEVARKVGAEQTFFVHMSHDIGLHAEVCAALPQGMTLAYDTLVYEW
jgi:phosphoribosyl 1,2-cyclic phosphate phosphodiesterase